MGLVDFLLTTAREGKSVAGYAASGKSATMPHYRGIGKDMIEYIIRTGPAKPSRTISSSYHET